MTPVAIEGSIAVGKSSAMQALRAMTPLRIWLEPVAEWAPFLRQAYSASGAVALQTRICLDTCCERPDADLVERNPALAPALFFGPMRESGAILPHEEAMLVELHGRLLAWAPAHTIWLRCSLEEARRRLRARQRESEAGLDDGYFEMLHARYDEVIEAHGHDLVVHTDGKSPLQVAREILALIGRLGRTPAASGDG